MFFFTASDFTLNKVPDLTGKVAIVTGSNCGIGRVCVTEMAKKGCTVIMACRSKEKTLPVIEAIKAETGNNKLEFIPLDLMSLDSVTKFADTFKRQYSQLHILLNNAGVMTPPFELSEDGIESQFATNHVAHFYLTMLLLPVLETSEPSRIVNVSSIGHKAAYMGLNLDYINDPMYYKRIVHYGKSKAAIILVSNELSRKLKEKGSKVYVNSCHPGPVRSNLIRHFLSPGTWMETLFNQFLLSTEDGAITQMYMATSPEIEEKEIVGKYFVPFATIATPVGPANSDEVAKEVWEFTENLIKEKVPSYKGAPI